LRTRSSVRNPPPFPLKRARSTKNQHSARVSVFRGQRERLMIYCQTTSVSAAHATHCATYWTPLRPLIRAFSGWIPTPPPTSRCWNSQGRESEQPNMTRPGTRQPEWFHTPQDPTSLQRFHWVYPRVYPRVHPRYILESFLVYPCLP